MELGHVIEVHAVDAGKETQWQKNDSDYGKEFDDLIESVRGQTEVGIAEIKCQLVMKFDEAGIAAYLIREIGEFVPVAGGDTEIRKSLNLIENISVAIDNRLKLPEPRFHPY